MASEKMVEDMTWVGQEICWKRWPIFRKKSSDWLVGSK
jgi:hypothetical protein